MTRPGSQGNPIHVVAAVLMDRQNRVLLGRRPEGVHQGGLWEFPGGKVESGETAYVALARELAEELGVRLRAARPLIAVCHDYPDRSVLLDVWYAHAWDGVPRGREGQAIDWVPAARLHERAFPEADAPVVAAVRLPAVYLITPEPSPDTVSFVSELRHCLETGVRLVQLRAPGLAAPDFLALAEAVLGCCREFGAKLLLNADPQVVRDTGADGVHLNGERLRALSRRPLNDGLLVGASCHGSEELAQAQRIGADFAVLSPVATTRSHPSVKPLGWRGFRDLVAPVNLPVYALGGMGGADLDVAWDHGAQGVASMSAAWRQPQMVMQDLGHSQTGRHRA